MNEKSDPQLLADYAHSRSESAFTELTRRHLDFVYSAALRMVRDPHLAEDVTQSVFIALAKNAAQLRSRPTISGWLHRAAQNIAAQTVRATERRRAREQSSAAMKDLLADDSDPWTHIAPQLDAALADLNDPDRDALLLRYFERKSARQIAAALDITDEAAQKRVTRALERLREIFQKRGLNIGATALAGAISGNAVQAAPATLLPLISTAAAAATVTTTATTFHAVAMTTFQKTITATAIALCAAAGLYQAHQSSQLRAQLQSAQQNHAALAGQIQNLQTQRDTIALQLSTQRQEIARLQADSAELKKLRAEIFQQRSRLSANAPTSATTNPEISDANAEIEKARALATALINGEPGAFEKLAALAKQSYEDFNLATAGLNANTETGLLETQRADLSRRTFAPLQAAFKVIEKAALENNEFAIDALVRGLWIQELRGNAARAVGALAGSGNQDALELLLNPNSTFSYATTIPALRPAAEAGNQKAIDHIANITNEPKTQGVWLLAAEALTKPAASGNPTAIAALIRITASTNLTLRTAAIPGLEAAADNQSTEALQTLRSLGLR